MSGEETTRLVEVWRAWGEAEIALVQGLLQSNGIDSTIRGESTRLTHPTTLDGLAEVQILVREEDARDATELILGAEGAAACPSCFKPALKDDKSCRFCGQPI